jgi:hypothetical protein
MFTKEVYAHREKFINNQKNENKLSCIWLKKHKAQSN